MEELKEISQSIRDILEALVFDEFFSRLQFLKESKFYDYNLEDINGIYDRFSCVFTVLPKCLAHHEVSNRSFARMLGICSEQINAWLLKFLELKRLIEFVLPPTLAELVGGYCPDIRPKFIPFTMSFSVIMTWTVSVERGIPSSPSTSVIASVCQRIDEWTWHDGNPGLHGGIWLNNETNLVYQTLEENQEQCCKEGDNFRLWCEGSDVYSLAVEQLTRILPDHIEIRSNGFSRYSGSVRFKVVGIS